MFRNDQLISNEQTERVPRLEKRKCNLRGTILFSFQETKSGVASMTTIYTGTWQKNALSSLCYNKGMM